MAAKGLLLWQLSEARRLKIRCKAAAAADVLVVAHEHDAPGDQGRVHRLQKVLDLLGRVDPPPAQQPLSTSWPLHWERTGTGWTSTWEHMLHDQSDGMPRDAAIPLESFLSPVLSRSPWAASRVHAFTRQGACTQQDVQDGDWRVADSPNDAVDNGKFEAARLVVLADVLQHVDDVVVGEAPQGEVPVGVDRGDLSAGQHVLVSEGVGLDACPQDPGPRGACGCSGTAALKDGGEDALCQPQPVIEAVDGEHFRQRPLRLLVPAPEAACEVARPCAGHWQGISLMVTVSFIE